MRYALAILALSIASSPAFADKLDGDWCNLDDGKLTINGSKITTPFGIDVEGNYGRHRFEYVAPVGDWHAGKTIIIQQFGDDLMELSVDKGQPKPWRPCRYTS